MTLSGITDVLTTLRQLQRL